ncbi:MAG: fibronectin type III domain-containing protein [Candidatus Wallbacteria bacterium]|nr:fibronectin type III domain-containing protein [Candidatus Wallbacteria bacterium]
MHSKRLFGLLLIALMMGSFLFYGCLSDNPSHTGGAAGGALVIGALAGAPSNGSEAPQRDNAPSRAAAFDGASVTMSNHQNFYTTAASNGEFVFRNVVAGNFVIKVVPVSGNPVLFPVLVTSWGKVIINLQVNPQAEQNSQQVLTMASAQLDGSCLKIIKIMPLPTSAAEILDNSDKFKSDFELSHPDSSTPVSPDKTTSASLLIGLGNQVFSVIPQILSTEVEVVSNPEDSALAVPPTTLIQQYYNDLDPSTNVFTPERTLFIKAYAHANAKNSKITKIKAMLTDKTSGNNLTSDFNCNTVEATNIFSFVNPPVGNYLLSVTAVDDAVTGTGNPIHNAGNVVTTISVLPTAAQASLVVSVSPGNLTQSFPLDIGIPTSEVAAPVINPITDADGGSIEKGDRLKITVSFAGHDFSLTMDQALNVFNDEDFTLTLTAKYNLQNQVLEKISTITFPYSGTPPIFPENFVTFANQESATTNLEINDVLTATVAALPQCASTLLGTLEIFLVGSTEQTVEILSNYNWNATSQNQILVSDNTPFTSTGTYKLRFKLRSTTGKSYFYNKEVSIGIYPPQVTTIETTTPLNILVTFDQKVGVGADVAANYTSDKSLSISNPVIQSGEKSVLLTTTMQTAEIYNVTVSNVKDLNGNAMPQPVTKPVMGKSGIAALSAEATLNTIVKVVYSLEPKHINAANADDALNPANYAIIPSLLVSSVAIDTADQSNKTYLLTTAPQTGETYSLQVSNVQAVSIPTAIAQSAGFIQSFAGDALPQVSLVLITTGFDPQIENGGYLRETGYTVLVAFNETMNTGVNPTVTIGGAAVTKNGYTGKNWTGTFTPEDSLDENQVLSISGAKDLHGNEMQANTANSFHVDTIPPVAPIITSPVSVPPTTVYYCAGASVNLTGTKDNGSAIYVGTDATPVIENTLSTSWEYTVTDLISDITREISIRSRDAAGNYSATTTILKIVKKDSLPAPVISVTSVTTESCKITWNMINGASGYKMYQYSNLVGQTTELQYTFSNLLPGAGYSIEVESLASWGVGSRAGLFTYTLCLPPSNLTVESSTVSSARISWANAEGADKYRYRLNSSQTTGETQSNSINLDNLNSGTTYELRVTSVNKNNRENSTYSSISFVTGVLAPQNVRSTRLTTSEVDLTWDTVTGATGYKVYIDDQYIGNVVSSNVYTRTNLSSGQTYRFSVRAVNATGDSAMSAEKIINTVCIPPSGLNTIEIGSGYAGITWQLTQGGVRYLVYKGLDDTSPISNISNSVNCANLNPATQYDFYIKAENTDGLLSGYSEKLTIRTRCSEPAGVSIDSITDSTARVNWNATSGASSYRIFLNSTMFGETSETTMQVTGLTASSSYQVYVKAVNSTGAGDTSETRSFTSASLSPGDVVYANTMPWWDNENVKAGIDLYYHTPTDTRLKGIRILRKTGSAPTGPTDAGSYVVCNRVVESDKEYSWFDSAEITIGDNYYYAFYTYGEKDSQTYYSTGTIESIIAQEIVETQDSVPCLFNGTIEINDQYAAIGTRIYAFDQDNKLKGVFIIDQDVVDRKGQGRYEIPVTDADVGELIIFSVNGRTPSYNGDRAWASFVNKNLDLFTNY